MPKMPPPNERWFARREGMKGVCDVCHTEAAVSAVTGYYDEYGQHVPFEDGPRWICAECHHGGPKKEAGPAKPQPVSKRPPRERRLKTLDLEG
jgi:hypothetical protein